MARLGRLRMRGPVASWALIATGVLALVVASSLLLFGPGDDAAPATLGADSSAPATTGAGTETPSVAPSLTSPAVPTTPKAITRIADPCEDADAVELVKSLREMTTSERVPV